MKETEPYKKIIETLQSLLIEKTRILNLRKKVFWKDKALEMEIKKLDSTIWELKWQIIKIEKWIKN